MSPSDQPKFSALLSDVMAYYGKDASTFMVSLWWDACKGLDFAQVQAALNQHARDPERGQFAPKVADIVRILEGTATERATIAWGKTLDAMERVGSYTDVVFDDAVIHAVVQDLGGWVKICRSSMAELSYLQHRFTESYRAYANRARSGAMDEYPRVLCGDRSPDETYERRGLPAPKPAVIGDVVQARLVWQRGSRNAKREPLSVADAAAQQLTLVAATSRSAA